MTAIRTTDMPMSVRYPRVVEKQCEPDGVAKERPRTPGAIPGSAREARVHDRPGRYLHGTVKVEMMHEERADRAQRLHDEGVDAFRRGDNDASVVLHDEAIAAATASADDELLSRMLAARSRPAFRAGDYDLVQKLNRRALQLARSAESRDAERLPLHMLSESLRAQKRYDEAIPLYERAIRHLRLQADSEHLAMEEYNLGTVLVCAGRLDDGERLLRSSLASARHRGDEEQVAYCVAGFGMLYALRKDPGSAGRLFGCSDVDLERRGVLADPAEQLERASAEAAARGISAEEFDAGYQRGRGESLMSVVDELLAERG